MSSIPLASLTVTLASCLWRSSGNSALKGSVVTSGKKRLS